MGSGCARRREMAAAALRGTMFAAARGTAMLAMLARQGANSLATESFAAELGTATIDTDCRWREVSRSVGTKRLLDTRSDGMSSVRGWQEVSQNADTGAPTLTLTWASGSRSWTTLHTEQVRKSRRVRKTRQHGDSCVRYLNVRVQLGHLKEGQHSWTARS
eukprot:732952-Rhodomonas_salina.2